MENESEIRHEVVRNQYDININFHLKRHLSANNDEDSLPLRFLPTDGAANGSLY